MKKFLPKWLTLSEEELINELEQLDNEFAAQKRVLAQKYSMDSKEYQKELESIKKIFAHRSIDLSHPNILSLIINPINLMLAWILSRFI